MNIFTAYMGIADFVCIGIILVTFGVTWWSIPLSAIMISKGGLSLL